MKKIAFIAALLASTPAFAAPTIWNGSGANDTISHAQFGPSYSNVSSGTAFTSVGGVTGTVATSTGGDMQRRDQGNGWGGNFAPGATLLWNQGSAGDITFNFTQAVSAVGAQFQADYYGDFTAQITLSDGSTFNVNGNANPNGDNSAPFIGAQNTVADISSITFHQLSGQGGNDFAIGNLSLITGGMTGGGVPEPATWALMILGFGGIGASIRYKRRRTALHFA